MRLNISVLPKGLGSDITTTVENIIAKKIKSAKKDLIQEMEKLDADYRRGVADVIRQGYFPTDRGGNVATRQLIDYWEGEESKAQVQVLGESKNAIQIALFYFSSDGAISGEYLTKGRQPGAKLPPVEAIADWASAKFANGYEEAERAARAIIFGKIRQEGIQPRPFLKKAADRFRRRKVFQAFGQRLGPIFKRAR